MNNSLIMIVEDDLVCREALNRFLKDRYNVVTVKSGAECLEKLKECKPDVILLDVIMPDLSGYETCQQIRSNSTITDSVIIFISGRINPESIMEGYESGGDDYINKPIDNKILVQKIELALKNIQKQRKMKEEIQLSTNTAFAAMRETSDYGQLLEFMRDSLECANYDELGKHIFNVLSSLQLSCCLKIRSANGDIDMSMHGEPKPLEMSLLAEFKDQGRFFDFKDRTIINFEQISLLVKNMPVDEPERYGRIRDSLSTLLTAANNRIAALDKLKSLEGHRSELVDSTIKDIHATMIEIEAAVKSQEKASMKTMDDMMRNMETTMMSLGLSESQEQNLLNIVQKGIANLEGIHAQSMTIDSRFERTISSLAKLNQAPKRPNQ